MHHVNFGIPTNFPNVQRCFSNNDIVIRACELESPVQSIHAVLAEKISVGFESLPHYQENGRQWVIIERLPLQKHFLQPEGHYVRYRLQSTDVWWSMLVKISDAYQRLGKQAYSQNAFKIEVNRQNFLQGWFTSKKLELEIWYQAANNEDLKKIIQIIHANFTHIEIRPM